MWSLILRDSDPEMTALASPVAVVNYRPALSSEREPHIKKSTTVWQ
jgi:hypothetical protein